MYSKQEASELREAFWTRFGQYMAPVLSADGERVNWINYKTGEKNIAFRMEATSREARIGIELSHKDAGIRQLYFEQFAQLRKFLDAATGEPWTWLAEYHDEHGRSGSRIFTTLEDVSILRQADWPALISFFKPRIIALDAFWSNVRYGFEELRG